MADGAFWEVHEGVAGGDAVEQFLGGFAEVGVAVDEEDGGVEFTKGGGDGADFSAEEIAVGTRPFVDVRLVDCDEFGVQ